MVVAKDIKKRVLKDLFVAISQGEIVSNECASVSHRYSKLDCDISPNTIRNYWARRKAWINEVFDLTDAEYADRELLAEAMMIKQEQWTLFKSTKNEAVKLGVLRDIAKQNSGLLAMFQDLGQVPMEPDDGNHLTMKQVDRFIHIIKTAYKDDPAAIEKVSQAMLHDYR